jgi:polysaccharide chain length determinant protein (PEP-CTERM system associated)
MHELVYQFASHLRAAWRYRWFAVATAWIIALCGWVVVHRISDRYEATVRLWVDTQSVLKPLLAGMTVQPNVQQLVGMLSRTLVSRPNLDKVIGMAGMESEVKTPEQRESLITSLSRAITVVPATDGTFTIAYADDRPERAELVVQSLLTLLVERHRSDQRKDSEAAQAFIDEEIKTSKEKLDAAEKAMIEFKRQQLLAASPRGDHAVQMASLETTLRDLAVDLKTAQVARDTLKSDSRNQAEIPDLLSDHSAETVANPELDARIKDLEQKLDALRLRYTDEHPDVVAMVRTIAQLEAQKMEAQKKAEAKPRSSSLRAARTPDLFLGQSRLALATAESNIANLEARIAEYSKRYEELKSAAIAAPVIDLGYAHLSRDYEMAKNAHTSLLSRREMARISDKMESAAVTNFRVVEPARVSPTPKWPNRPRWNSAVLLVALGGGIALAYLLSQLMPTIRDERRLREVSGVQVLATVLKDWTDTEKRQRIRDVVAFLMCFVTLLSAYAAVMFAVNLPPSA